MNTKWVAIDPGTHASGVAWFQGKKLIKTFVYSSNERNNRARMTDILIDLQCEFHCCPDHVVCEAPTLRGKANNSMQKLLGAIEWMVDPTIPLYYIHPMTMKKRMGSGRLDKLGVAEAARDLLTSKKEKAIMQELIENQEWDASDAVAVGLAWMQGEEK